MRIAEKTIIMKRNQIVKTCLSAILLIMIINAFPQIFHKNKGVSQSVGTVSNGKLVNGYKLPYKANNYKFFSFFDYYILGRCYVHSDLFEILNDSYAEMKNSYPEYIFRVMECSRKNGGRPFPHKTHQNGTSVDFMTPLKKDGKTIRLYDHIGMWRYAMNFDENGKANINKNVEIDFDIVAKHILTLEKTARSKGWKIKKVILETNLKDEIYSSKYGNQLIKSGIYFVKSLPAYIDKLHDDHYHIDFVKL